MVATIIIVSTYVLPQNLISWLKFEEHYDVQSAIALIIIAFIVGITILGPQIEAIQDEMLSDLSEMTIVASLIVSVAGLMC